MDYFLIWGHGLQYSKEIIDYIRSIPEFEIQLIKKYRPRSISRLIKKIYSYDYAPYFHLKAKTKYLNI